MQYIDNKTSINEFLIAQALDDHIVAVEIASIIQNIIKSAIKIYKILQLSGFHEVIGYTGEYNSCGDRVRKLDKIADDIICDEFATNPLIGAVAGEEREEIVPFPDNALTSE